jgi:Photosynthesis system II assembly factor YCF48
MVRLPQFVLQRLALPQAQWVDHPDADALTAFGEQRLNERERGNILAHLAQCGECRQVLALTATVEPNNPIHLLGQERIGKRRWLYLGWAAPLVAACLVIGILRFPSHVHKAPPQATAPASPTRSPHPTAGHGLPEVTNAPAAIPAPRIRRKFPRIDLLPRPAEATVATVKSPAPAPPPNIIEPAMEAKAAATSLPVEAPNLTIEAFRPQPTIELEAAAPAVERQKTLRAMPSSLLARIPTERREQSLWSLDRSFANVIVASGTVEKSSDGGKTWQAIHVSDYARLYALSAVGANIWVGGAGGILFHSADDGLHWAPVIVDDGEVRLSGTITGIENLGGNSIHLKVQSAPGWVTSDSGRHWRRD